jgi:predicted ATP-dependent protease
MMLTIGVSTTSTTSSVTDMNKAELIDAYAQQVLDNMDMKTLEMYAYDMLVQCFEDYTEEELITEVSDHYPELLEG